MERWGTVDALEFIKRCLDGEAVVVKEVGGWKAVREEKVQRVGRRVMRRGEMGGALL